MTTAAFAIKAFLEGTRTYAPSVVEMTCGGAFLVAIDARERLVASTRHSEDWPINRRNLLPSASSPVKAVRRGSTVDSGGTASLVLLQMSDSDAAERLLKEEMGYNVVFRRFVGLKD